LHESLPVDLLGCMLIVGTAEQPNTVRSVQRDPRETIDVIEFQGACLRAPPAALVQERALPTVALEDRALDRVRDVARGRMRSVHRRWTRFPTDCEAFLLDLFNQ